MADRTNAYPTGAVTSPAPADFSRVPGATGAPLLSLPKSGHPWRVLLATASPELGDYAGRVLTQQGYQVDAVRNGDLALQSARRQRPDLLITDLAMPGLDGAALLRELRADPKLAAIPVVVLSDRNVEETRRDGIPTRAHEFLSKPFSGPELVARVDSQLQISRLRRETALALENAARTHERQQRLYEAVASATPDLIYVFDRQHRFTYANKALLKMWGRTWEDACGKNCLELGYEPWHAAMHDREIEEVVATKRSIRGEVAFTGTNGRRFYDYIFSPVIGTDGEVEAIAGTTRDVTEHRQAAAAARFIAELMERLTPLADEAAIIKQTVAAVGRHFEVHRCYFIECHESEDFLKVGENWVRDDAPSLEGEYKLSDFGGPEWWREYTKGNFGVEDTGGHPLIGPTESANYLKRGVRAYAVQPVKRVAQWTVALAITENQPRKWLDDQLRLLDNVAARVWPLVERVRSEAALRAARDQAIAASRAKDDFLAILSHELRTPLNPVLLVASESAADAGLPDQVRGDFKMIADNVALQARLIDDLLDFNRIVHGKVTLEKRTLDLHEVVRNASATIQEDIAAKRIGLTFSLHAQGPVVYGDPVRLRQVIWNVLKNAVKFTPPDGHVDISSPDNSTGGMIELRIRDSGIGMQPEELARIFQPFVQGKHAGRDRAESYGGLGLGLAISRLLVELHGGTLTAASAGLGAGSTVIIRLPRKNSVGRQVQLAGANGDREFPAEVRAQRILFVEDHEPTRTAMTRLLKRRGFEVSVAHSVQEGLEHARHHDYDVLISDLGLPDGDGCELMLELRKKNLDLRGIALSGFGMESDVQRTRQAGFAEHLTKPVSVDSLDRALLRVLQDVPGARGR